MVVLRKSCRTRRLSERARELEGENKPCKRRCSGESNSSSKSTSADTNSHINTQSNSDLKPISISIEPRKPHMSLREQRRLRLLQLKSLQSQKSSGKEAKASNQRVSSPQPDLTDDSNTELTDSEAEEQLIVRTSGQEPHIDRMLNYIQSTTRIDDCMMSLTHSSPLLNNDEVEIVESPMLADSFSPLASNIPVKTEPYWPMSADDGFFSLLNDKPQFKNYSLQKQKPPLLVFNGDCNIDDTSHVPSGELPLDEYLECGSLEEEEAQSGDEVQSPLDALEMKQYPSQLEYRCHAQVNLALVPESTEIKESASRSTKPSLSKKIMSLMKSYDMPLTQMDLFNRAINKRSLLTGKAYEEMFAVGVDNDFSI
ncbi:Hypothetical protein PP7435_CHR1-0691 [Komagataella phaffii CBS 7435]|uniref:Uncharacterized protein n=2 Tax=Komagataella phaffii TaxID=460519 RepID=C4QWX4_KOMPG|nr:Hypothetical protein PAS_chr1-1_0370 [Komagataella phaffii GS115]AOA60319.1 GQ67_02955T0 [Komagataella phaffii]CAH2446541.1 Hypothetical protein BQ9382_C1-3540 [Komagataella phaffii CBS 7435]AOA65685.1 GQ68_02292T0 [Komagataella phaffii GS115]CAY67747.1 Hypothetical protein PAS_chr1-1_0370 [Komagataella phaffii GS115]CCA36834.1 Hypothetical protein PP7435_CHR1-0691 [Komagataella phaffii CBS 7435]